MSENTKDNSLIGDNVERLPVKELLKEWGRDS